MTNISSKTHIFTSCTNCYLPKARVLGKSIKQFHPEIQFHLILSDLPLPSINLAHEPFDSIITVEELNIPHLKQWIFKHSVVEMCTAVKGVGFQEIFRRYNCDQVIFFDPDIVIFSPLDELLQSFEQGNILLTPHQLEPEKSKDAVIDNEICFLRHGVFNLGFLGVKNCPEGQKFLGWWSNRCLNFCYDDTPNALFTDQRWIDLVPTFFTGVSILRSPAYNVANWNLTNREVTGNLAEGILVNGKSLCFYHFSGSQSIMPEKYNVINSVTASLIEWYQQQCEEMGQQECQDKPCFYTFFDNGELITYEQRIQYRHDVQLQDLFPNPFDTSNLQKSYFHYCQQQQLDRQKQELQNRQNQELFIDQLKMELEQNRALIEGMESSKFWKIRTGWFTFKKLLRLKVEG
jgi:hypothetical protein